MNIAIVTAVGIGNMVADKCEDISVFRQVQKDSINFVDHVFMDTGDLPSINTSVAARTFSISEKTQADMADALGMSKEKPVSYLTAMYNGETFSDWLEASYSSRFMDGEVGIDIGFSCGIGIPVDVDVAEALPQFKAVASFIHDADYKGQIRLGVTEDYNLCSITFGFFPGLFAMFCESCKSPVREVISFCAGEIGTCNLYSELVACNLVSKSPWPHIMGNDRIRAISSAERHIWRMKTGNAETVLVTAHGSNLMFCRNRIFGTVRNLLQFDDQLQYRTNFHSSRQLVLMQDQWKKMSSRQGQIESHSKPALAPQQEAAPSTPVLSSADKSES